MIIAKAWKNGKHLANNTLYGIRITAKDRDAYFKREWKSVILYLNGEPQSVMVNIDKDSFWEADCIELINNKIKYWLNKNKKIPWPKGYPPEVILETKGKYEFEVSFK